MNTSTEFRQYIQILEAHDKAYRIDLPYKRNELEPVLSAATIDLHYGTLHKNYVDKALDGINYEFSLAGAELHNLYFAQFRAPSTSNRPHDASLNLIEREYGNYDNFRRTFKEQAITIAGSGWACLTTKGEIKTIQNHKSTKGIALIIDMWEHAYILDYDANKEKYVDNFWKIVDWSIVNARIETS